MAVRSVAACTLYSGLGLGSSFTSYVPSFLIFSTINLLHHFKLCTLLCTLSYGSLETITRPQSYHSLGIESTSGYLSHNFITPKPPLGKFTSLAVSFSRRLSIAAWHAGLYMRVLSTLQHFRLTSSSRHARAPPSGLKLKVHVRELSLITFSSGWPFHLLSISPFHFAC